MKKLILAFASGIILALGWPTYGLPLLLFFGFVPLLCIENEIRNSKIKRKKLTLLGYAYVSFFIWNLITTSWLRFADPFGASFAVLVNALLMALVVVIYHSVAKRVSTTKSLLFLITLWISFEKLHLGWEFSWPRLNLGNGFSEYYTWIQWYEYTGTFGGTLWVWIVNAMVYTGLLKYKSNKNKLVLKNTVLKVALTITIPIIASAIIFKSYSHNGNPVNVIALQPNIDPYSEKYNVSNIDFANRLIELSNSKIKPDTDLIIAPETYFADNVRKSQFENALFKNTLDRYISKHQNLNILSGISFIEFLYDKAQTHSESNYLKDNVWYNDYNSAVFLNKSDSVQYYNKSKLVVGVENFPYQEVLKPIIGDAMIDLGGTVAMKTTQNYRTVFTSANKSFKVAPIICYESVYGEFVTEYVRNGANVLAIATNDGWWNTTQGHKQHLSYARLRAIETRREIARSANTGISAIINAKGEITSALSYGTQGALEGKLTTNEKLTLYTIAGDYIARISIFISLLLFLITMYRKKKIT